MIFNYNHATSHDKISALKIALNLLFLQIVGNFTGVFPFFTEFKLRMFVMRYFNFSEVRYYPLLTDVSEIICPAETHVLVIRCYNVVVQHHFLVGYSATHLPPPCLHQ